MVTWLCVYLCVGVSRIVLEFVGCSGSMSASAEYLRVSRWPSAIIRCGRLTSHHRVGSGIDCVEYDEACGIEWNHRLGCRAESVRLYLSQSSWRRTKFAGELF